MHYFYCYHYCVQYYYVQYYYLSTIDMCLSRPFNVSLVSTAEV